MCIVDFHSFLVWLGCGSSLIFQHFASSISLNLRPIKLSFVRILLLKNLKLGVTNRQVQNTRKLLLKNPNMGLTNRQVQNMRAGSGAGSDKVDMLNRNGILTFTSFNGILGSNKENMQNHMVSSIFTKFIVS